MIIVSSVYHDVVGIKWINNNPKANIESEREKIIEEKGKAFREYLNSKGNLEMIYDSYNSVLIIDSRGR